MTTDCVLAILVEAKKLARRYRALTGKPGQRIGAIDIKRELDAVLLSGKFNLRISPQLHEKLVIAAQVRGTSINALAQQALLDRFA